MANQALLHYGMTLDIPTWTYLDKLKPAKPVALRVIKMPSTQHCLTMNSWMASQKWQRSKDT